MTSRRVAATFGITVLVLVALPAGASATSPWWQIDTGSRPTNLWEPADEVQELQGGGEEEITFVEVQGEVVACMGIFCEFFGLPDSESAAQLQSALEVPYGAGSVEVVESPAASRRFLITGVGGGAGRYLPPISVSGSEAARAKVLTEGGSGRLVLTLTNVGDAPVDGTASTVTITDQLPAGAVASHVEGFAGYHSEAGPVSCSVLTASEVSCSFADELPSFEAIEIEVWASLTGTPPASGAPGTVSVSGGGAASASTSQELTISPEKTKFGIESFSMRSEEEEGATVSQAGSHPFQLTTSLQLNAGAVSPGRSHIETIVEQPALPRNFRVALPPGLVGNPTSIPTCSFQQFTTRLRIEGVPTEFNECPAETAVGVASVTVIEAGVVGLTRYAVPIFNLEPAHGEPARFGFFPVTVPVTIDTALSQDGKYRISAISSNNSSLAEILATTVTFWGNPGDPRHDEARGWECAYYSFPPSACSRPPSLSEVAFLRQPVSCNAPLEFGLEAEPWNVPIGSVISDATSQSAAQVGCSKVPFDPSIAGVPTSRSAEAPSGLDFELSLPNSGLENPVGIAETEPKKVEVTLPEGITVNPSEAEGLAVCTPADYARETLASKPGEGCPEASKLGSVVARTPLLEEPLEGSLYIAAPHDNPFDSLLALYLVAKLPARGVIVKQAGVVRPDPRTGQLVTTFDDLPQLPYSDFRLHFREGGRAPLVTPPGCGTFQTVAKFVPWSAQDPDNPAPGEIVERKSSFTIDHGVDGGACPSGAPPFAPGFQAGAVNNNAGSFSPFDMRLTRRDGEQDMTRFSTTLPPGELGSLAGVARCPQSAVATARAKSGRDEIAAPSCPPGSEIGHTLAGAGVGSVLTYVPGKLYLGGPFHGDPLSVIAITPAVAGPFDVGTVVVQEALTVNPKTAEVEVDGAASEPIPHILAGIPLKLRDLRVYADRPHFTLNPTSCEEMDTRATLFGGYLNVFSSADDVPVGLSARYQAAGCARLGFKPRLGLELHGGTRRGAHPALQAVYRPRPGDANLKQMVVRLPRSAFLDQSHIRTICTRVQFAAHACPARARYGSIKAWTPLLDEPLQGPVWLRSSSHKLPDLVFDLHGLVDVEVAARLDSIHGGIRATIEAAPDAPITAVVLHMQGAKKGLIVNSRDICAGRNRVDVQMVGQNGKAQGSRPTLRNSRCGQTSRSRARHRS